MASRSMLMMNQTLNVILGQLANIISGGENLAQTLQIGNSAGSKSINMNGNPITSISSQTFSNNINIQDQANDAQILSNNNGRLQISCSSDLVLDVNGSSIIELTPSLLSITSPNINLPNGYLTLTPQSTFTSSNLLVGETAIDASSNNLNIYDGKYWNKVSTKMLGFGYNNQVNGLNANQITFTFKSNYTNVSVNSLITLHMNSVFTIINNSTSAVTTIMISGMMVTLNMYNIMNGQTGQITSSDSSCLTTSTGYADLGMYKIIENVSGTWITAYPNYPQIIVNNFNYNQTSQIGSCNIIIYPAPLSTGFTGYNSCSNGVIELKSDTGLAKPYNSQFTYTSISLN